jgi:hypothetical protein
MNEKSTCKTEIENFQQTKFESCWLLRTHSKIMNNPKNKERNDYSLGNRKILVCDSRKKILDSKI